MPDRPFDIQNVSGSRFGASSRDSERDDSHPYVKYDPALCISCARCVRMCDEVQGTFALAMVGRGGETVMAPGSAASWDQSDCVSCGACVSSCPSGALSEPGLLDPRPLEPLYDAGTTLTQRFHDIGDRQPDHRHSTVAIEGAEPPRQLIPHQEQPTR